MVSVYVQKNQELFSSEETFSFDKNNVQRMKYTSEFLMEMTENVVGVVMRDFGSDISGQLQQDIKVPEFYDGIAQFEGLQVTQGQYFIDKAQYSRLDQFLCMVDGEANLRLVPHINRPEMYAGHASQYYNKQTHKLDIIKQEVNESPVNLFSVDEVQFPNTEYIIRNYHEDLAVGDCIYVPAFYFC